MYIKISNGSTIIFLNKPSLARHMTRLCFSASFVGIFCKFDVALGFFGQQKMSRGACMTDDFSDPEILSDWVPSEHVAKTINKPLLFYSKILGLFVSGA